MPQFNQIIPIKDIKFNKKRYYDKNKLKDLEYKVILTNLNLMKLNKFKVRINFKKFKT